MMRGKLILHKALLLFAPVLIVMTSSAPVMAQGTAQASNTTTAQATQSATTPPSTATTSSGPKKFQCPRTYGGQTVISCWLADWHTTGNKTKLRRNVIGTYTKCGIFTPSMYHQQISCGKSKTSSATRSNSFSVSGGLSIGYKGIIAISGEIKKETGYSITKTRTVTYGTTVTVPAPRRGAVEWAPVYGNRYRVQLRARQVCYYFSDGTTSCFYEPGHYTTITTGQVLAAPIWQTITYWWQISVDSAPAPYRQGFWRTCVRFDRRPHSRTLTCHVNTTIHTNPDRMADVRVSLARMSRRVGYDVMHKTPVNTSKSFSIHAHRRGRIEWAPAFYERKVVHQTLEVCFPVSHCHPLRNRPQKTVIVEKYSGIVYRRVYD